MTANATDTETFRYNAADDRGIHQDEAKMVDLVVRNRGCLFSELPQSYQDKFAQFIGKPANRKTYIQKATFDKFYCWCI